MQSKQLLLLLLTAISGVMSQQNIVDTLTSGGLNSLLDTIKQYPDLVDTLSKAEKLTVFAPTDAAFQKLQASPAWATIKDDKEAIKQILLYHVSDSLIESKDIKDGTTIVDTLVDANYKAFRNLTEDDEQVVKVVKDGNEVVLKSRFEQESKVTKADVKFSNGVAHVIDTVLFPPTNVSATAQALQLDELVNALIEADLVETVDALSEVTIFAPTNEAFEAVNPKPTKEQLTNILTYHVVPKKVEYSTDLEDGDELVTLQGEKLKVKINDTGVFINNAQVVAPDVLVNSGVVHGINAVLVPSGNTNATPSNGAAAPAENTNGSGASMFGFSSIAAFAGLMAAAWGMI